MVKKILILFTFLFIIFIPNVNAADTWTGTNWAANAPTRIEVFGYRNEDGNVTYPYSSYQPIALSAFNFNGYRANGWNGYSYSRVTGTGYSLTQYTNSFNLIYNNYSFLSASDYVTLKGQIMPSNQIGIDILKNLSWYITANYGSSNVSDCVTNTGQVSGMYFANFECSFPRTNSLVISLHFNNYTTYNQGAQFMIRNDYSDVMYSNDNTSIITGSIGGATQGIINNQNSNTNQIIQNNQQNTQDIINNQNQNNQNIINNQNSNTNQIIQDNQQNTQDIINNQNQNTQQEIQSQQVCNSYDKNALDLFNKYLQLNGTEKVSTSNNYGISKYFPISSSSIIKVLSYYPEHDGACFYNVNRTLISCVDLSSYQVDSSIPIPSNSSYFRFTIHVRTNVPRLEICSNGNQALNDSVNNLNDSITSEDSPNTNQDINDMNDMVASDTPISDLITMPLTLINAYINGVNSSCSPVNLGNLYGTDLVLPCIDLEQRLGSNLWHIIDAFFSIFMCYNIAMLFITAFDGITSLRDDFEGLYQPRHADTGYVPKHGGGN